MLQICPSGPSCCTKSVEEKLGAWSEKQYRDALFNKTTSMAGELDQKATQVDGKSITPTAVRREPKMDHCRLHLRSSKQSPEGVPRYVYKDIRGHVSEERRCVPGVFSRLEDIL